MKILSSEQVRELDQYSIKNEPISSINLMERAALKFAQALHNDQNNSHKIYVFCGMGNNGGDGLAVARLLLSKYNYNLQVYVVGHMKEASPDFQKNEKKMEGVHYIKNKEDIPPIEKDACVIDALFGTGLSRPVEGIVASVIQAINQSGAYVYSIDMPSGLYCDQQNESRDAIIQADKVYTFHAPKLSFFFPSNGNYVRSFEILDIGLNQEFEKNLNSDYSFITVDMPRQFLKKREKFSHKGSYGHALIAAGSMGKMGAAILALKGAQRSGAGLVSAYVPGFGYSIVQSQVPEAMLAVAEVAQTDFSILKGKSTLSVDDYSAIGVGPGIGTDKSTALWLESLFDLCKSPLVLDADALNIIAERPTLLKKIPAQSILTPHPGEFKRLVGAWKNDLEKIQKQLEFSANHDLVVVLKGANTSISTPNGKLYFNSTGNPGMAKGGSGDVLTGVLTSILAQGYTSEQSAILAVYVHGLAGDIACRHLGEIAMNAEDIIHYLPQAFKVLASSK